MRRRGRAGILETLARAGRENSDATVILHAAIARLMGLASSRRSLERLFAGHSDAELSVIADFL